jgi:hypothetical protein
LPDACCRTVAPKIFAIDFGVGKPDRAVMVVIWRTGMPHARETLAGRAVERKEKRPGIFRVKMPPQPLVAIDLERDLIVRQRNNLTFGKLISHAQLSRRKSTASRMRLARGSRRLYLTDLVIVMRLFWTMESDCQKNIIFEL